MNTVKLRQGVFRTLYFCALGVFVFGAVAYVLQNKPFDDTALLSGFSLGMKMLLFFMTVGSLSIVNHQTRSIEKKFFLSILLLGALYMVLLVPFSVPDEQGHYMTAYTLASQIFHPGYSVWYTSDTDFSGFAGHFNVSTGYLRVLRDLFIPAARETFSVVGTRRFAAYFIFFPQVIAMVASLLLRLNFVWMFYLGRFFNLLFYSGCVYLAIKRAPSGKMIFGLLAMTPLALQQAASFSYDSFIIAVGFLFVSSLLKCIQEEGALPLKDFLFLLISGVLLFPVKVVYIVALLPVLWIPTSRFGSLGKKWTMLLILIAACAAAVTLIQISHIIRIGEGSGDQLNWEGERNYTLSFVLQHPYETMGIFFATIRKSFFVWQKELLGGFLSGLTLVLPKHYPVMFGILLAISMMNSCTEECKLRLIERVAFFLSPLLVMLLVMLAMMLAWTSETRDVIQGVQGRYFLPVAPMTCLALSFRIRGFQADLSRLILSGEILLHAGALLFVLNYTLAH